MEDFSTPQNDLEQAIEALDSTDENETDNSKRRILAALALNTVIVILPPLDEDGNPPDKVQPLFVSDGLNRKQAMLAAFTRKERAVDFQGTLEKDTQVNEITGVQLLLGCPDGVGVMLNPNQPLGLRISPELAKTMRAEIQVSIDKLGTDEQPARSN